MNSNFERAVEPGAGFVGAIGPALRPVCAVAALLAVASAAFAHSSITGFSADEAVHDHGTREVTTQGLHPGVVVVDPRRIETIVVKINARVVGMRPLYVGKTVARGEVLAELESAEMVTVQNTYLSILNNMSAVQQASVTAPQKLIEARMALRWRGMTAADIDKLEATRQPLKRIAIRAPAGGTLYSLNISNDQILNAGIQTGLFTAAGTTVASVAAPDAFLVETAVPVDAARRLRTAGDATVYLPDAGKGWVPVAASIQSISALPVASSQRQVVRVVLRSGPGRVARLNGLTLTVGFKGERDAVRENLAE
jgi:hypothetical protein